jgi:hypothetical protein
MLKRLVILFAVLCLTTGALSRSCEARAHRPETPLQKAIAKLTPQEQATLKAYETARRAFRRRTSRYWHQISRKRKKRRAKFASGRAIGKADYVTQQPPVYKGPKRPAAIMAKLPKPPRPPVKPSRRVPIVDDFLHYAKKVYGFKPDGVEEDDFMISYAMEALKLGLSRDQVVRLYALETGGMGTYDLQSGYNRRTRRAASTALGYAQLLAANTIEQVREEGGEFAERLERMAAEDGVSSGRAARLRAKAAILRRMIADARKVRNSWGAHVAYAKTPKGIGMHALNLDGDIGPWLQVVKLKGIADYAAKKGKTGLTGGQLELMNLAGPASGFEMMHPIGKKMPTANFFERGGYERNPVVARKTGEQLLAKIDGIMDRNVQKARARRFAQIFDAIGQRMVEQSARRAGSLWDSLNFIRR